MRGVIPYFPITHLAIGPFSIPVWGLFVSLAFVVSLVVLDVAAKRARIRRLHVVNFVLGVLVSSMVGARVVYVVDHARELESFAQVFALWDGGLGMLGGMAGGLMFLVWYVRANDLDFWSVSDMVSRVLPLGIAVGRMGCHFIGDHPGKPTGGDFGFVKWDGIAYHEPAAYEAVLMLGLFLVFLGLDVFVARSRRDATGSFAHGSGTVKLSVPHGAYTIAFVVVYGWMRLALDFTRVGDPLYFGLTLSQYASAGMIVVGAVVGWRVLARGRKI